MAKFSKKELVILILVAFALFTGLTALIMSQFPSFDEFDEPTPSPEAAVFVYTGSRDNQSIKN